jgi:hypothetical protein
MMKSTQHSASTVDRQGFSARPVSSSVRCGSLFRGLLFAAAMIWCAQVQAQTSPNSTTAVQKPAEKNAPVPQELLKKALKNAKAISPEETPRVAETRPVQPKASPNPAQQKLLPNNSALPEASPESQKAPPPAAAKTPNTTVEVEAPKSGEVQPAVADTDEKTPDSSNGSIWEPTGITVSRLFLASSTGANGEVRKVPMSVPVLYESRLLALDKDKQRAVAKLLDKLVSYRARLAAMRKEGSDLMVEWNQIVGASTPQDLLLSDSPTLIEKEGDDTNRANAPGFEPGKGVSIEVKSQ